MNPTLQDIREYEEMMAREEKEAYEEMIEESQERDRAVSEQWRKEGSGCPGGDAGPGNGPTAAI